MECKACGYKYEYEYKYGDHWRDAHRVVICGDEEFIEINGHFTYTIEGWHTYEAEVSLYACPKCYTVIASIW